MTFDTTEYRFSHSAPRGFGRWAFCAVNERGEEGPMFWTSGTYTEAKKAARRHFAGAAVVRVMA